MQFYALGVPRKDGGLDVYVAVSDPDDVIRSATRHYQPTSAMVRRVVEAVVIESLIHQQCLAGLVRLA
jgi:hypothetical protein